VTQKQQTGFAKIKVQTTIKLLGKESFGFSRRKRHKIAKVSSTRVRAS
jgi:hypothetical protein